MKRESRCQKISFVVNSSRNKRILLSKDRNIKVKNDSRICSVKECMLRGGGWMEWTLLELKRGTLQDIEISSMEARQDSMYQVKIFLVRRSNALRNEGHKYHVTLLCGNTIIERKRSSIVPLFH